MKAMNFRTFCLLCTLCMGSSLSVKAQQEAGDTNFQPRIGITLSTLGGDDDAKQKLNLTYGLDVEYFLADMFSVSAGILFTDQGAKYKYPDESDIKMNIYYAAVPLTASYYVLPGLAVKAGLQPSFRVKTRMERDGEKIDFDRAIEVLFQDDDFKMNKFDLAIPMGLSYEFKGVTLDARYNLGLLKIFSGLDDSVYNRFFSVTLGYKFQ